jgi:hypothetical protein
VPADTPVTTPVPEPIVADEVLPLVHVPPLAMLLNDVVLPAQTLSVPKMGGGAVFTVTVVVPTQPGGSV